MPRKKRFTMSTLSQTLHALWQLSRKLPKTSWLDYGVIYGGAALVLWFFSPPTTSEEPKIWDQALDKMPASERLICTLITVFDGDTIGAQCAGRNLRLRLHGIDAPEMQQQPYGETAKSALQAMLPTQFSVHSAGADIYQRTLATLYVQEQNLNEEMVRQGYAVAYADKSTPARYRQAEAVAKRAQRGVWREAGLQQDPKAWRRYYP